MAALGLVLALSTQIKLLYFIAARMHKFAFPFTMHVVGRDKL